MAKVVHLTGCPADPVQSLVVYPDYGKQRHTTQGGQPFKVIARGYRKRRSATGFSG